MNVILTHEHADFDAVASLVGLARLVPGAVPVLPQSVNENVADFLTLFGSEFPLRRRDELPRSTVGHAWLVDTAKAQSVRGMSPSTVRSCIDHHVDSPPETGEFLELDVQRVGATATLIAERIAAAAVDISAVEATLLLLGIYEDTGSLTFPGTTARDLRAAAWLLERGADLRQRSRFLRHALSSSSFELQRRLLDVAETVSVGGHDVVVAAVEAPGFADEIATIASKMLDLLEPAALFVLIDLGTHVQVVGRGAGDAVDVGAVAEALGGGGHSRAAAAVVRGVGLDDCRRALLGSLPDAVTPARRVRDIMSWGGVVALHRDDSIEQAAATARRHGHEGYPVLADDTVVGVVTRSDLDRALHHHLGAEPVSRLIAGRVPAIGPDDSVEALRRVMMEHDAGQVPVVEEGRMVGIVTRTDVLGLWSERQRRRRETKSALGVGDRLADVLAPEQLDRVRQVAAAAVLRRERAFLVGGLPRDLLLGVPRGPDIDVVVEGDAPALARDVAGRHGGRVVAFARFGTAKWLSDGVAIDLTSARSEYYREPTALPSVARGSLRSDLRRRDFTINTLAVDLHPDRFGEVIDLFGGVADIGDRTLRVLHSLSFVEDPTRILRAMRFEMRLGFRIEEHTLALVPDAVGLIRRVSGARLLAELVQLMVEPDPVVGLERLAELGVLEQIQPGLVPGRGSREALAALDDAWRRWRSMLPAGRLGARPTARERIAAWLAPQGDVGVRTAERLRMRARDQAAIRAAARLLAEPGPVADGDAAPSSVYHALRLVPPSALVLAWACAPSSPIADGLLRYATELASVRTEITGADLLRSGHQPGPEIGRALRSVLDARLDGTVTSRDEELAMAEALLSAAGR